MYFDVTILLPDRSAKHARRPGAKYSLQQCKCYWELPHEPRIAKIYSKRFSMGDAIMLCPNHPAPGCEGSCWCLAPQNFSLSIPMHPCEKLHLLHNPAAANSDSFILDFAPIA